MIRTACFATLLLILVAGSALAETHPGSNVLGLSTSADGDGAFRLVDPEPGAFDLHLLVYGYEHAQGIAGWECAVELPSPVEVTGVTLVGKPDPVAPDPADFSLRVFPLQPLLPTDGIVHLATLHLNLIEFEDRLQIHLRPHSQPRLADAMSFALESSSANDQLFAWPGDCADCPVFELVPSAQPVVSATWDDVKSLYR